MRFVYIVIIALITVVVMLFKYPGIDQVTVSFLAQSVVIPIAVLVFVVYILGIVAGGALLALLRSQVRRATPKRY